MISPHFVISMLGLDGLEMSKACVASVLASTLGDFVLVLTNNGSKDGTAEFFDEMAKRDARVRVVHNAANEGFIPPNNAAFEVARELNAQLFITLNNDMTVPPNWLNVFAGMFDRDEKLAVSGPQGTISQVDQRMVGNSAQRYEYAEGSCMCVRVLAVLEEDTLFAPYLKFIYFDDLELALRLQRSGWKIAQAPFRVAHRNGSTCTRHPDAIRKCRDAMIHNQRVMLTKWAHWNKVRCFDFPIVFKRKFASGDALLMTPIIRAVHEEWPLCPIDVETGSPGIFYGNPLVRKASAVIPANPKAMVIDLNNAYERFPTRHVLESYAAVAGVDATKVSRKCELYGYNTEKISRRVAVHVGPTTWPGKNWPMDRWRTVIVALAAQGWHVMLFGDKSRETFPGVEYDIRAQKGVRDLASMIAGCDLFVGLDSFPMHVAQAVGTPVVALFGVTDPRCFMTEGSEAIAVCSDPQHVNTGRRNKVPNITFLKTDDSVMRTISVDQVLAAVNELTNKESVCSA